jgi:hypothetical protein
MGLAGFASGLSFQNFSLINTICCFRREALYCWLPWVLDFWTSVVHFNLIHDTVFHTFVIKSQGSEQLTKEKLIEAFSQEPNSLQPLSSVG